MIPIMTIIPISTIIPRFIFIFSIVVLYQIFLRQVCIDYTYDQWYNESRMKKFSFKIFLKKYPTNESCLDELFKKQYPGGVFCIKCTKNTKYFKLKNRTAYSCTWCRTQLYPLAGTIFEKSSIDLRLWFYAMFLMIKTRSGISAKQLERELGVCYKTAHRMFKQIRTLMDETNSGLLIGEVEVDETFVGGKGFNRRFVPHFNEKQKDIIMGMIQRNGKAYLKHIPNTGKWTLLKHIQENVDPMARVITDQFAGYMQLPKYGYQHDYVNHSKSYVLGDIHTQNIEGLWSSLKRGLYGVYRHVSPKYLQQYSNEYAWRYNHRNSENTMFEELLTRAVQVRVLKAEQLV